MTATTPDSPDPESAPRLVPLSDTERKAILDQEVNRILLRKNRRLEHRSDFQAIIVRGKPVNHILHLLLTIFTIGIWAFVWLAMAGSGGEKRAAMQVDRHGQITITQL